MNKQSLILIVLSFSFILVIKGQDPHFSQYFSSPLTLNPAMAGYFKGDSRLSANFRQQWSSVGDPFITNTISYDAKLMQTKIPANDIFAVGILGLYDQSLNGGFKNINVSADLSYHKSLDADGKNNLGLGFQFTYASRMINITGLNFATQFNGSGFDNNLPSNESFTNTFRNYLDINTGLLYTFKTEKTEFYLGASLYHLGTPNISFLKNDKFNLPMRYTIHAGSRFKVGDNGNDLFIGGLYMEQAGATEQNLGIAYGMTINDEAKLYAGTWYRINDAVLPYIGLNYKSFEVGFSYDVITSGLNKFSPKNNSIELSLNVLIAKPKNYYTNYKGGKTF